MATLFQLSDDMLNIERILEDNGGELTEELAAAWDETSVSLRQKVDDYFCFLKKKEAEVKTADEMIKFYQARKKVADNCVKNGKKHLVQCMQYFNMEKMEGDLCKMSLRRTQSLDVDEAIVLKMYEDRINDLRHSLPSWLDVKVSVSKTAIKEAFAGTDILPEGVHKETNVSLNIK